MRNNEVFRQTLLLTGLSLNKPLIQKIFALGGLEVTQSDIRRWRTPKGQRRGGKMKESALQAFYNGFFIYRDRQAEAGTPPFAIPRDQKKGG
ncbi:DUF1456 family protein [Enterovibrio norvegicus]|uniref:DUF1456 family protein n=1 Tax=Enterovibrio norvegicus TaxID=188144 RepID=UPI00352D539A